jgi:retron-type reverse transcriptase
MINGVVNPRKEGAMQGGPLSPLLSNIVLDELDQELEKRGLEFCIGSPMAVTSLSNRKKRQNE